MRTDLLRWGGISSVLLAILFAAGLVLTFTMGVDIYADDDVEELLTDIDENQEAFAAWAILGMAAPLLFIPAALGFFYTAREEDRAYLALPAGFFGLAGVLAVFGSALGIILPDVADNYAGATGATRDALLRDGENLQSMLLIIGGVSFTPFALGMLAIGVLSLRSGFFPRWLAWPVVVVGVLGAIPFIGFVVIVPGRIAWLLVSGILMLRRSRSTQVSTSRGKVSPATA